VFTIIRCALINSLIASQSRAISFRELRMVYMRSVNLIRIVLSTTQPPLTIRSFIELCADSNNSWRTV